MFLCLHLPHDFLFFTAVVILGGTQKCSTKPPTLRPFRLPINHIQKQKWLVF
jgi:hypothetical protein